MLDLDNVYIRKGMFYAYMGKIPYEHEFIIEIKQKKKENQKWLMNIKDIALSARRRTSRWKK